MKCLSWDAPVGALEAVRIEVLGPLHNKKQNNINLLIKCYKIAVANLDPAVFSG